MQGEIRPTRRCQLSHDLEGRASNRSRRDRAVSLQQRGAGQGACSSLNRSVEGERAPRSDGGRSGHPIRVSERFVVGSRHPQAVQENGKLAGDGRRSSLLRGLATASGEMQAVPPQIAVGAERAE